MEPQKVPESAMLSLQQQMIDSLNKDWNSLIRTILVMGAYMLVVRVFVIAFSRLFLSPLAGFPGPKLAAATALYELYFTVVLDGQWGRKIGEMHRKYGPIVRINPWELSIRDSSFFDSVFVGSSTRRTNMWARGREGNGFEGSHHLTVPHDLHRQRRKHLETFFSRSNLNRIQEVVVEEIQAFESQLVSLKGSKTVIKTDVAFTALTGDITGHVACGARLGLIDDADFSPKWHDTLIKAVLVAPLFKSFPNLNKLISLMPSAMMESIYPKGVSGRLMGDAGERWVAQIKQEVQGSTDPSSISKKSVFHHLLTSKLPENDKSVSRLRAEAMIFLIAGSVTSAHSLSIILYHVLSSPEIETKLRAELAPILEGYPVREIDWSTLERAEFLQAIIKETLRLTGLVGNLSRVSPDVPLRYGKWTIPKNTPVGMSIFAMHTDPAVWTDPMTFAPERWLGHYDPMMDRNFVPFVKGSRNCLGMNLAMTELTIATAILFRPEGPRLRLFETTKADVEITRDFVMGFPDPSSKGVRVLVE